MSTTDLPCPVLVSLAVAEELLERFAHLHSDTESASGAIKLHREIAERMHQAMPCTPATNSQGQLVCSLGNAANDLTALLCQPNLQSGYAVQLDAVAKGETADRTTGMFL